MKNNEKKDEKQKQTKNLQEKNSLIPPAPPMRFTPFKVFQI